MPHDDHAMVTPCYNEEDGMRWQVLDARWCEQAGWPIRNSSLPHFIVAPAPHLIAAGQSQGVIMSCAYLYNCTAVVGKWHAAKCQTYVV